MVLQNFFLFLLWEYTYSWLTAKLLRRNTTCCGRTGKIVLFGATQWTLLTRKNLETEAMVVWSRELEITAGTTETPELREEGSKAARPIRQLVEGVWTNATFPANSPLSWNLHIYKHGKHLVTLSSPTAKVSAQSSQTALLCHRQQPSERTRIFSVYSRRP